MTVTLRSVRLPFVFLSAALLFSASSLFAQTKAITGVIKSENQSVPGATIVEKGTSNGTVSDVDGKFSLTVSENSTIVVSFIGMKTQEIVVGGQTAINVDMLPDTQQLSEVVVIGYGTVEKKDLTTSVSSINSRQLKDIPINSAAQALAGRLAGVQVVTAEGSPNAQVQIRVRGGGSVTQDNTPLFVVDGIQVENALSVLAPQDIESIDVLKDASATAIYGARGANGVVIITTKGGRQMKTQVTYSGLFGVKQLANKLSVMNPYDFVNYQYERSRGNTTAENNYAAAYGNYSDIDLYRSVPFVDWQEETFGRDALMQTHNIAVVGGNSKTAFNISITGNQEDGIMINSDFDRQILNLRLDHKFSNLIKVGLNGRVNNTIINGPGTSNPGSSSTNRLRQSVKYRPILFPGQDPETYDPDYAAQTSANSLSLVNPVLLAQQEYRKEYNSVYNINGYVEISPLPYLSFRSNLGFDYTTQQVNLYYDTISNTSKQTGQGLPLAQINSGTRRIINNSNVINFSMQKLSESFAKNNKLDVLIGQEIYETTTRNLYNENRFISKGQVNESVMGGMQLQIEQPSIYTLVNYDKLALATTDIGMPVQSTNINQKIPTRLLSFFSRANYSFKDKYLVAATIRADGSSKFAPGNEWGYFPSASVAWRISSEPFMESLLSTVNDVKFRASYGEAGNNRIDDFGFLSTFELGGTNAFYDLNNTNVLGYRPVTLANEKLKWETTITRNIGVDMSFLQSRIQFSLDVYSNTTSDLLIVTPVPTSSGYLSQTQNVGKTTNHGYEIQLQATIIRNNKFTWSTNFNFSQNINNIESLGRQQSFLINSGWNNNSPADFSVAVGQQTGVIWGLETDGYYSVDDFSYDAVTGAYSLLPGVPDNKSITSLDARPGVIKFKDRNSDGLVNDLDRTSLGSANPKFFGGWNNTFTYGNFDMSIFINYQYGNKVLNANKLEFTSGYTPNANLLTMMNDRWRNVNDEGVLVTDPDGLRALNPNPALWSPLVSASSFYVHSWAVEDGSFIRINNVTLGYTLPPSVLEKIKIAKVRFYATVNNLAIFTNYSGYDPDVNTRRSTPITPGVDYSAYPRSRTYIVGLNVTF